MGKRYLVVVDMQNDFVSGALANDKAKAIIPEIRNIIQTGGYDGIVFTRDDHYDDYLNTHEGKQIPIPHCIHGTEGSQIIPELQEFAKVQVFKRGFGFVDWKMKLSDSEREEWVIPKDVECIDICGTVSEICVFANAVTLRSTYPEADIRVIANACANLDVSDEDVAFVALDRLHVTIV